MQSGAIKSCETAGYAISDHFRGATKMVKLGSGAEVATALIRKSPPERRLLGRALVARCSTPDFWRTE